MHLTLICRLVSAEKIDDYESKLVTANGRSFSSNGRLKQTELT